MDRHRDNAERGAREEETRVRKKEKKINGRRRRAQERKNEREDFTGRVKARREKVRGIRAI